MEHQSYLILKLDVDVGDSDQLQAELCCVVTDRSLHGTHSNMMS